MQIRWKAFQLPSLLQFEAHTRARQLHIILHILSPPPSLPLSVFRTRHEKQDAG